MRHDDGSDAVRHVTLTTKSGHSFTLRYSLRGAAQALADAHNALSSVARPVKVKQGEFTPPGTVDRKVMDYVG